MGINELGINDLGKMLIFPCNRVSSHFCKVAILMITLFCEIWNKSQ